MANEPKNLSMEALKAQLAALQSENAALKTKAATARPFTCKVSEKGAVSAYGLGRFPVTLYASQWETLLAHGEDIRKFIAANEGKVARKENQ